jgi:hypothetical protein
LEVFIVNSSINVTSCKYKIFLHKYGAFLSNIYVNYFIELKTRSVTKTLKVTTIKKGGFRMAEHFCTCKDLKCKNHPRNHTNGCDPCIQKNLKHGEIPACFFRAVGDDLSQLNQFTYQSFAGFVRQHLKQNGCEDK